MILNLILNLILFIIFLNLATRGEETKKYYYEHCKTINIEINDFDNEYLDTINILKGELMKYYILINNDDNCNVEQYIITDDIIEDLYNFLLEIYQDYPDDCDLLVVSQVFDIDNLSRDNLGFMISIYKLYCNENPKLRRGFLSKMNIKNCNYDSDEFDESIQEYLDSLTYKSIYERELDKIIKDLLKDLPSIKNL